MSDLLTPDERHRLNTAHDGGDAIALAGVVHRLEAKVKQLQTALRFYAGKAHYPRQLTGEGGNQFRSPVLEDGGQRARAAIGGK